MINFNCKRAPLKQDRKGFTSVRPLSDKFSETSVVLFQGVSMAIIIDDLGKTLTAAEMAAYLGLDIKTVRKYHRQLGGIRIGRRYLFFEMEVYNAIQTKEQIHRTIEEERTKERKNLPDEEGSVSVGGRDAATARRRMGREDKHGLFR